MCGIAGIIHSDPSHPVLPESIQKMCDAMAHRGPDDFGHYVKGHVGIGMRRLSIIDLETGKQPITNEDGTIWVVFNGEIYNYRELRKDLEIKGHRFRTTSDTEVIVHLFEELEENCVQRLRGMFAFAIWDARRQSLVLGRDRLGIKPLYYAETPEGLMFASELKALLTHPGIRRDLDPQAVAEYFTHLCVPGDRLLNLLCCPSCKGDFTVEVFETRQRSGLTSVDGKRYRDFCRTICKLSLWDVSC
jgi:asparagine synthase (glutamine-hydrolysing)